MLSENYGFYFHEVSALTGKGIKKLFEDLSRHILVKLEQNRIDSQDHPGVTQLTSSFNMKVSEEFEVKNGKCSC